MKQDGIALTMYAQDYDETLPPTSGDTQSVEGGTSSDPVSLGFGHSAPLIRVIRSLRAFAFSCCRGWAEN
jgi:hypothetical protein